MQQKSRIFSLKKETLELEKDGKREDKQMRERGEKHFTTDEPTKNVTNNTRKLIKSTVFMNMLTVLMLAFMHVLLLLMPLYAITVTF